jgi:hypothetical protein
MQAGQYAEDVGLKVVGYYQASERLDDTSLVPVGEKVAGKIKAAFAEAVAFVVRLLSMSCAPPRFHSRGAYPSRSMERRSARTMLR